MLHRAPIVMAALAALAGCRDPATVWCGHLRPPQPGQPVNPLLEQALTCFDHRAACERAANDCDGIRPMWACKPGPSADFHFCYPAPLCGSECTKTSPVYCTTHEHRLSCFPSSDECERIEDLASRSLHVDAARCERLL